MPVAQPVPEELVAPEEPLDPKQAVPVIETEEPENGSSPELSNSYLHPPGLEMDEEKHAFTLSDVVNEDDQTIEPWPVELAGVDINIAPDGTFIETSSGPAARELKRRYDQRFGVSLSVRSPYAITAFVNQHGKQMFRVGHRELSAPAASSAEVAAEVEDRLTQSKATQSKASTEVSQSPQRNKRRSRMSMHTLFPPNVFMTHRPSTTTSSTSSAPKKLRKARSIPDMASIGGEVNEHGELASGSTYVPTHTGRAHSQSVTAVDMPRFSQSSLVSPPPRNSDFFGDVMDWFTPASSSATSFSSQSFLSGTPSLVHTDSSDSRPIIAHPFGVGVSYETPLKRPPAPYDPQYLPAPRHVRLMQSFESGLTARQDDPQVPIAESLTTTPEVDGHRPASAIRLMHTHRSVNEAPSRPSSTYEPPAEASMLSAYATSVFDVLQTYRGLPNLDKLADAQVATVKISLSTDLSAVPRDDPRFVIWGESVDFDYNFDGHSASRDSITSDSVSSKRRGSKVSRAKSPEASNRGASPRSRILLAATIERWVAQLTSDLNYDDLLDFFLTYRSYISGVDLCHILISRFQWALQQPKNSQDESVRQVVRVRTFVAIRFWLVTFFTVDFIPNRELRLLVANWLNTLIHDPLLKQHPDSLGIVRRLAKVAKECKQEHVHTSKDSKERSKSISVPKSEKVKTHLLGQKFAEAVMKDDEDSDVDLDFLPDEAKVDDPDASGNDPANAHLAAGHVGAGLSLARPTSLPLSSFNILQRMDQPPGPASDVEATAAQLAISLPMHNSALSRAFVKTIGRLGRLKRVLHSRSSARNSISTCTDVSAFDMELNTSRDLLNVNGGVERYLKGLEPSLSRASTSVTSGSMSPPHPVSFPRASIALQSVSSASLAHASAATASPASPPSSPLSSPPRIQSSLPQEPMTPTTPTAKRYPIRDSSLDPSPSASPSKPVLSDSDDTSDDQEEESQSSFLPTPPPEDPDRLSFGVSQSIHRNMVDNVSLAPSFRPESIRSFASSTGSLGEVLDGEGSMKPMFSRMGAYEPFDIVSLDEFDMSDTSSEVHESEPGPSVPPGLRKQARKLPMRKDFEFLPRRSEISSMGIVSRASVVSGPSSNTSSASATGLGGNIQQWQMNALLDSLSVDGEDGDVDAALKRLEGQINPQKMKEKRSKVDGWVKQIQARLAAGDYDDNEESRFPADSDEEDGEGEEGEERDGGEDEDDEKHESVSQHNVVLYPPGLENGDLEAGQENGENPHTPIPTPQALSVPGLSSSSSSSEVGSSTRSEGASRPAVEEAVPVEILRSRVSTILPPVPGPDLPVIPASRIAAQEALRVHQSFILSHRAHTLAEHFSMIDRDLFMGVKFEELMSPEEWLAAEEVNVYDWAQYLKDRATWKAEGRNAEKTTALAAVRARFNLMANFVVSEVVLTQPGQRALVVAKFIRIAWKSYQLSNFNTLVAILAALQGDKVAQAMRKSGWNKVGNFETRIYRDLKVFVSSANGFSVIRSAIESIVDAKPMENGSHSHSAAGSSGDGMSKGKGGAEARPSVPTACVPFIGVYLAQLNRLKRLPDLIDPTSPNETVGTNLATGDFDPPAHPEVFDALAPLPPGMRIEPLVNVHKQRKIAAVVKSLVAGQHIASRVQFGVDKKLFGRCLRLRALDPEMVQRAMGVYSD
ncbi:hypothetical protein D9611_001047 [Ephemerocybe angulata]|uniref:Ras GEF n=1 Tax=Ephemerocybe angulata TaxID=980116 RepID=A0A8H5BNK7_9AGAR|nr:hypothetical protein D9611_001047 [Tulosesus angulatus]